MKLRTLVLPLLLLPLAACMDTGLSGGSGYYGTGVAQAQTVQLGTVVDSRPVQVGNPNGDLTGAVVGGLAGALVGNQFGKGSGNALATGAGAVGGAIAGTQIARQRGGGVQTSTEWTVRLDDGRLVRFQQPVSGVPVGSRVSLTRAGDSWRMVF
ncbi:MAG: glycine zipper 2TM domain-containing protein [Pseudomonadota bacterium]|jgi:outer membrane lipoprotein SlyB